MQRVLGTQCTHHKNFGFCEWTPVVLRIGALKVLRLLGLILLRGWSLQMFRERLQRSLRSTA